MQGEENEDEEKGEDEKEGEKRQEGRGGKGRGVK